LPICPRRYHDDEAAAHGDMQLVPMLEVEMDGNTVPLALARHRRPCK
jgi:hypothetical protein